MILTNQMQFSVKPTTVVFAQSAGAVEYTDCTSPER